MSSGAIDLSQEVVVTLRLGHLLFVWETMSAKLSTLNDYENMSDVEKRAVWGLIDLLERAVYECGIPECSQPEWAALLDRAADIVNRTPVEYLD